MLTPDPYLPHSGDLRYAVRRYALDLDYRVEPNRLSGTATLDIEVLEATDRIRLDLVGMRVSRVAVNGARPAKHAHRSPHLDLHLGKRVGPGTTLTVAVTYAGNPRPRRTPWGEVGFEELREGSLVAGQPNGAPTWFPCNDRPNDKATYELRVTTESSFEVAATGELKQRRTASSRTTRVFERREPTPTYLVALHVGPYAEARLPGLTAEDVPQRILAPRGLHTRVLHDCGRMPAMMRRFGEWFGPYPLPSYTVVVTPDTLEIPLEAMGLSVFGANHMGGRRAYERLVAHELAHSWFGNSLTAGTWQDIWLHEGFACYAEWLWSEASGGPTAHACAQRAHAALRHSHPDVVIGRPGAAHMFDDVVYQRGALTVHAVRLWLGDAAFFAMLRRWVANHRFGSVTTPMFVAHVRDTCLPSVPPDLLEAWLMRRSLPELPHPRRSA